jgi:hypothetical protein
MTAEEGLVAHGCTAVRSNYMPTLSAIAAVDRGQTVRLKGCDMVLPDNRSCPCDVGADGIQAGIQLESTDLLQHWEVGWQPVYLGNSHSCLAVRSGPRLVARKGAIVANCCA